MIIRKSILNSTVLILIAVLLIVQTPTSADGYSTSDVTLRAVAIHQPPFVFINRNETSQDGRYYGFLVDLFREITSRLHNVSLNIYEVEDGLFGSRQQVKNADGTLQYIWNGMIGDLVSGKAHLALGPLSVSSTRYSATYFTPSYLDTGLSILVPKADDSDNPFSFLKPFSYEVWILILISVVLIGIFSWIFDRLSPFGYSKQDDDSDERSNLNLSSSFLNSMATITGISGGETGRSWSTRILLIGYFIFAMICLSTYTANLAAFLTTKIQVTKITSLTDLRRFGFKFGVPANSDPAEYIKTSNDMADIRKNMILYSDLDGCVEALRKNEIEAIIWDNTIVEYVANREPCDTLKVGELFDKKNMALAISKNVSESSEKLLSDFSEILLELRENGVVDKLVQSWWVDKGSCHTGDDEVTVSSGISIHDFWGIFLLLIIFFVLAWLALFFELIFYKMFRKTANIRKVNRVMRNINECLGGNNLESDKQQPQDKPTFSNREMNVSLMNSDGF